jgi:hypothetical protein
MLDLSKIAIKGTSQEHLPIEDIQKDLVILKNGTAVMILKTSSVNFDLLSEKEQDAMIYAYAALLNSLTYSIQILVRSTSKDVSNYLNRIKRQGAKISNPLLRKQLESYHDFVENVVEKNNVLAKSFYVAVPFYPAEMGAAAAAKSSMPDFLSFFKPTKKETLTFDKEKLIEKAKAALEPKKEHLSRLFGRLGLTIKQLETKELIRLFYKIYNPESSLGENVQALSQQGVMIHGPQQGKADKNV